MKYYIIFFWVLFPYLAHAELEKLNNWEQLNYNYSQYIFQKDITSNTYFRLNANKNDALFVDSKLIYFCNNSSEEFILNHTDLIKLFNNKEVVNIEIITSNLKRSFSFLEENQFSRFGTIIKIESHKSHNTIISIAIIILSAFFLVVKLVFPVYYSFVFLSLKSSFNTGVISQFKNGSIFFSAILSSIIIAFSFASYRFNISWQPLLVGFMVVLVFFLSRFIVNKFFSLLFNEMSFMNHLYLDWLFNVIRISFLFVIIYFISELIGIDISPFYRTEIILLLILPSLINIYTSIKNINILPINFLFLYICALEILPTIVLVKIL